jgi:hypothetical protein
LEDRHARHVGVCGLGDVARASTARCDERMDLGLMLGWTNATDASTALRFDRGST